MSDEIKRLLPLVQAQDFQALARLLTILEREGPSALVDFPSLMFPTPKSFRIGVTGPPGAGKSTLCSGFVLELRARDYSVAILAVDPSSPFTGGAVLGDRIRYQDQLLDKKVFMRSVGSRGSLGGLSASAYLMVRAFDLAGFDYVLIETVGVGQTELEVLNLADLTTVVLVPEAGDVIQGMKAGLLEIADFFIVNKSDRPGSDVFKNELQAALHLASQAAPEVFSVSALQSTGLTPVVEYFEAKRTQGNWVTDRQQVGRLVQEARALLRFQADREIENRLLSLKSREDFSKLIKSDFKKTI